MTHDEAKNWKNRLCHHHQAGSCYVKDCSFAHGDEDLQFYKTSLCLHHQRGNCRYGTKCKNAHGKSDLRRDCKFHFEFKYGCNQGSECKFSHQENPGTVAGVERMSTQNLRAGQYAGTPLKDLYAALCENFPCDPNMKMVEGVSEIASQLGVMEDQLKGKTMMEKLIVLCDAAGIYMAQQADTPQAPAEPAAEPPIGGGVGGGDRKQSNALSGACSRVGDCYTSGNEVESECKSNTHVRVDREKWKNRLCDYHQAGSCPHLKDCSFAHGEEDLQFYKTSLCQHHPKGRCLYGTKCKNAHGKSDLRRDCKFHFEFKYGCNQGSECKFSHQEKDRKQSNALSGACSRVGDCNASSSGDREGSISARVAAPAPVQAVVQSVRDALVPAQNQWEKGPPKLVKDKDLVSATFVGLSGSQHEDEDGQDCEDGPAIDMPMPCMEQDTATPTGQTSQQSLLYHHHQQYMMAMASSINGFGGFSPPTPPGAYGNMAALYGAYGMGAGNSACYDGAYGMGAGYSAGYSNSQEEDTIHREVETNQRVLQVEKASVREQETSQQAKATFAAISASKTKFDSQNMPGSNRDDFRLRTSARDLRPTTSNLKSEQVELSEQDRLEMQSRRKKLEAEWNNAPLHNVVERNRIEREINRIDVALKPGPTKVAIGQLEINVYRCAHRFERQEIWDIFAGRHDGRIFSLCNFDNSGFPGVAWRKDLNAFIVSYRTQDDADRALVFFQGLQSTAWKKSNRPEADIVIRRLEDSNSISLPRKSDRGLKYALWVGSSDCFPMRTENEVMQRFKEYLEEGEVDPTVSILRGVRPSAFVNFKSFKSANRALTCEREKGAPVNDAQCTSIVLSVLEELQGVSGDGIAFDDEFEEQIAYRLPNLYETLHRYKMSFQAFLTTYVSQERERTLIEIVPDFSSAAFKIKPVISDKESSSLRVMFRKFNDPDFTQLEANSRVVLKLGESEDFLFKIEDDDNRIFDIDLLSEDEGFLTMKTSDESGSNNCTCVRFRPRTFHYGNFKLILDISTKQSSQPSTRFSFIVQVSDSASIGPSVVHEKFIHSTRLETFAQRSLGRVHEYIPESYQTSVLKEERELMAKAGVPEYKIPSKEELDRDKIMNAYSGMDEFEKHKKDLHKQLFFEEDEHITSFQKFMQNSSEFRDPLATLWKNIGINRPDTGTEFENYALAQALEQTKQFSFEEIERLALGNLTYDCFIKVMDSYFRPAGKPGEKYDEWDLKIDDPSLLAERRPSLAVGDRLIAWSNETFHSPAHGHFDHVEFRGPIVTIMRDSVRVHMPKSFGLAYKASKKKIPETAWSVRFTMQENDRLRFRKYHFAIDRVIPSKVHHQASPLYDLTSDGSELLISGRRNSSQLRVRSLSGRNFEPSEQQRKVIEAILRLDSLPNPPPFLLSGPFGTGKTATLLETALQIFHAKPLSRIYICTETNSAADLYIERLHEIIQDTSCPARLRDLRNDCIFRLLPPHRKRDQCFQGAEELLQKYTYQKPETGEFGIAPNLSALRVIVGTWEAAALLQYSGLSEGRTLQGFFTHIFVDEAAQMIEPAAYVPICMARESTVVVLAGDCNQIGPKVLSKKARQAGLDRSIVYHMADQPTSIQLKENFRNHQDIVKLCSKLFYNGEIFSRVKSQDEFFSRITSHLLLTNSVASLDKSKRSTCVPVIFTCIKGEDKQDMNSPSFFNTEEAAEILEICREILSYGQGKITQADIQIISAFKRQTDEIRKRLRNLHLDNINVGPVDSIQGREKKVVIISPVRADEKWLERDWQCDEGFVFNTRRLNSAMSRASDLLVIVGHPNLLANLAFQCESRFIDSEFLTAESRNSMTGDSNLRSIAWRKILEFCQTHGTISSGDGEADANATETVILPRLHSLPEECLVPDEVRDRPTFSGSFATSVSHLDHCSVEHKTGSRKPQMNIHQKKSEENSLLDSLFHFKPSEKKWYIQPFYTGELTNFLPRQRQYEITFRKCSVCSLTEPENIESICFCANFQDKTFRKSFPDAGQLKRFQAKFDMHDSVLFVPEVGAAEPTALFIHKYEDFGTDLYETLRYRDEHNFRVIHFDPEKEAKDQVLDPPFRKSLLDGDFFDEFGILTSSDFYISPEYAAQRHQDQGVKIVLNNEWSRKVRNGDLHLRQGISIQFPTLVCVFVFGDRRDTFLMALTERRYNSSPDILGSKSGNASRTSMSVLPQLKKDKMSLEPLLLLQNLKTHRRQDVYLRTIFSVVQTELFFLKHRALEQALLSRKILKQKNEVSPLPNSLHSDFQQLTFNRQRHPAAIHLTFCLKLGNFNFSQGGQLVAIFLESTKMNDRELYWGQVQKYVHERWELEIVLIENCKAGFKQSGCARVKIFLETIYRQGWTISFFPFDKDENSQYVDGHIHAMAWIASLDGKCDRCGARLMEGPRWKHSDASDTSRENFRYLCDICATCYMSNASQSHPEQREQPCPSLYKIEIPGIKEILHEGPAFHARGLGVEDSPLRRSLELDLNASQVQAIFYAIDETNEEFYRLIIGPPGTGKTQVGSLLMLLLSQGPGFLEEREKMKRWRRDDYNFNDLVSDCYSLRSDSSVFSSDGGENSSFSDEGRDFDESEGEDEEQEESEEQKDNSRSSRPPVLVLSTTNHVVDMLLMSVTPSAYGMYRFGPSWRTCFEKLQKGVIRIGKGTNMSKEYQLQYSDDKEQAEDNGGIGKGLERTAKLQKGKKKKKYASDSYSWQTVKKYLSEEVSEQQEADRDSFITALDHFDEESEEANRELKEKLTTKLRNATLIGATISGATKHRDLLCDLGIKYVLVDEAAMILEADLLAALPESAKRVILLGDNKQVAPNLSMNIWQKHDDVNLTPDYMRANTSLFERLLDMRHSRTELTVQYRMPAVLADNLRRPDTDAEDWPLYMHSQFKDCEHFRDRVNVRRHEFAQIMSGHDSIDSGSRVGQNRFLRFIKHDFHISTEDAKWLQNLSEARSRPLPEEYVNVSEAKMILSMLEWLLSSGVSAHRINIVVMYRAQGEIIRELMIERAREKRLQDLEKGYSDSITSLLNVESVKIFSVDSVQGGENDIMLLSLSRTTLNKWINDYRRINVALSRSRVALFVFGNFSSLVKDKDSDQYGKTNWWAKILSHANDVTVQSMELNCRNHRCSSEVNFTTKHHGVGWSWREVGCSRLIHHSNSDRAKEILYCEGADDDTSTQWEEEWRSSGNSDKKDEDFAFCKCGHDHEINCHPQKFATLSCRKPCKRFHIKCGHFCMRSCGNSCQECLYPVIKYLSCGHVQNVPCHLLSKVDCCSQLWVELSNIASAPGKHVLPPYFHRWPQVCSRCKMSFMGGCFDKLALVRCSRCDIALVISATQEEILLCKIFLHCVDSVDDDPFLGPTFLPPIFKNTGSTAQVHQTIYLKIYQVRDPLLPMQLFSKFIRHLGLIISPGIFDTCCLPTEMQFVLDSPTEMQSVPSGIIWLEILLSTDHHLSTVNWNQLGTELNCQIDLITSKNCRNQRFAVLQPQSQRFKENLMKCDNYGRLGLLMERVWRLLKRGQSDWSDQKISVDVPGSIKPLDVEIPEPKVIFYSHADIDNAGGDKGGCETRAHHDILSIKSEFFLQLLNLSTQLTHTTRCSKGTTERLQNCNITIRVSVAHNTLQFLLEYIYSDPASTKFENGLRKKSTRADLIQLLDVSFCIGMFHLHNLCDSILAEKCSTDNLVLDCIINDEDLNIKSKWYQQINAAEECCKFFPDSYLEQSQAKFVHVFGCIHFPNFAPRLRALVLGYESIERVSLFSQLRGNACRSSRSKDNRNEKDTIEILNVHPQELFADLSVPMQKTLNTLKIEISNPKSETVHRDLRQVKVIMQDDTTRMLVNVNILYTGDSQEAHLMFTEEQAQKVLSDCQNLVQVSISVTACGFERKTRWICTDKNCPGKGAFCNNFDRDECFKCKSSRPASHEMRWFSAYGSNFFQIKTQQHVVKISPPHFVSGESSRVCVQASIPPGQHLQRVVLSKKLSFGPAETETHTIQVLRAHDPKHHSKVSLVDKEDSPVEFEIVSETLPVSYLTLKISRGRERVVYNKKNNFTIKMDLASGRVDFTGDFDDSSPAGTGQPEQNLNFSFEPELLKENSLQLTQLFKRANPVIQISMLASHLQINLEKFEFQLPENLEEGEWIVACGGTESNRNKKQGFQATLQSFQTILQSVQRPRITNVITSVEHGEDKTTNGEVPAGSDAAGHTAGATQLVEYLAIIHSTDLDSEKTKNLMELLQQEERSMVLQVFAELGMWCSEGKRPDFKGIPDWNVLAAMLLKCDISYSESGMTSAKCDNENEDKDDDMKEHAQDVHQLQDVSNPIEIRVDSSNRSSWAILVGTGFVQRRQHAVVKVLQADHDGIASGLMWTNVGTTKPTRGLEIFDAQLSKALMCQTHFTQEERNHFCIEDLRFHNYIKSDACYFKPARAETEDVSMPFQIISSEHHLCIRIPLGREIDSLHTRGVLEWEPDSNPKIDDFGESRESGDLKSQRKIRLRLCVDVCGIRSNEIRLDILYMNEFLQPDILPILALEDSRKLPDCRKLPDIMLDIAFYLQRMYPNQTLMEKSRVFAWQKWAREKGVSHEGDGYRPDLSFVFSVTGHDSEHEDKTLRNIIFISCGGLCCQLSKATSAVSNKHDNKFTTVGRGDGTEMALQKAKNIFYHLQKVVRWYLDEEQPLLDFVDCCKHICKDEHSTTVESYAMSYVEDTSQMDHSQAVHKSTEFSEAVLNTLLKHHYTPTDDPQKRGGFGCVRTFRDNQSGSTVVIKLNFSRTLKAKKLTDCCKAEYIALTQFDSDFIVKPKKLFQDCSCIVMEDLGSMCLNDRLNSDDEFPEAEALKVFMDVLSGLAHMHERGWVHNDVKPKNIMLQQNRNTSGFPYTAVIVDLGLAKEIAVAEETDCGGTLQYASPAYFSLGEPFTDKSDIFMFGLTFLKWHKDVFFSKWCTESKSSRIKEFAATVLKSYIKGKISTKPENHPSEHLYSDLYKATEGIIDQACQEVNTLFDKYPDPETVLNTNLDQKTMRLSSEYDVLEKELITKFWVSTRGENSPLKNRRERAEEKLIKKLVRCLARSEMTKNSAVRALTDNKEAPVRRPGSRDLLEHIKQCLNLKAQERPSALQLLKNLKQLQAASTSRISQQTASSSTYSSESTMESEQRSYGTNVSSSESREVARPQGESVSVERTDVSIEDDGISERTDVSVEDDGISEGTDTSIEDDGKSSESTRL